MHHPCQRRGASTRCFTALGSASRGANCLAPGNQPRQRGTQCPPPLSAVLSWPTIRVLSRVAACLSETARSGPGLSVRLDQSREKTLRGRLGAPLLSLPHSTAPARFRILQRLARARSVLAVRAAEISRKSTPTTRQSPARRRCSAASPEPGAQVSSRRSGLASLRVLENAFLGALVSTERSVELLQGPPSRGDVRCDDC